MSEAPPLAVRALRRAFACSIWPATSCAICSALALARSLGIDIDWIWRLDSSLPGLRELAADLTNRGEGTTPEPPCAQDTDPVPEVADPDPEEDPCTCEADHHYFGCDKFIERPDAVCQMCNAKVCGQCYLADVSGHSYDLLQ